MGPKGLRYVWVPVGILIGACLGLLFTCGSHPGEGFAIYLLKDPHIAPADLPKLSHLDLADSPLISSDDVISYSRDTHKIELSPAAYWAICDLQVPVEGLAFAVCIDKRPVYTGAFWTPISSLSYDGVVVLLPPRTELSLDRYIIQLQLGYPSSDWFTGQDPRADPTVFEALERAGKLH